jgi:ADP-glucose pyrophosphorylase
MDIYFKEMPRTFEESLRVANKEIYIIKTKFLLWVIDSVSECFQTNTAEDLLKEIAEKSQQAQEGTI